MNYNSLFNYSKKNIQGSKTNIFKLQFSIPTTLIVVLIFTVYLSVVSEPKTTIAQSSLPQNQNSYFYSIKVNDIIVLTQPERDFLATHYNYILVKGLQPDMADEVRAFQSHAKTLNPKLKVLKYNNGAFDFYYHPPYEEAYAHYQNMNTRITDLDPSDNHPGANWFVMDLCSQGTSSWRNYFSNQTSQEIVDYGVDGIFVDDMGMAGNINGTNRISNVPQHPDGGGTWHNYTDEEWASCGGEFLNYIKQGLPNSAVMFNGLYHNFPPFTLKEYLSVTDGGMREGWITSDYINFLDENVLNGMLDNAIQDLEQYGKDFAPLCILNNPTATIEDAMFCYTAYLLVNKIDKVHYGGPGLVDGSGRLHYRPELSIDLGAPIENGPDLGYYRSPVNSNLFERDYIYGKVIFNPSGNEINYALDKKYQLITPSGTGLVTDNGNNGVNVDSHLDFLDVTDSITIRPRTGVVLQNTDPGIIVLNKTANSNIAGPGSTITYTINYANNTGETDNNVVIKDSVPLGASYQPGSAKLKGMSKTDIQDGDEYTYNGGVATWNLGTLNNGDNGSVSFQVTIN